ncbi:serpin family protein [Tenuifilum sp.]|uniref:serpin family protein n=1 Tax=Tenuifilum sp. TaxID=2760880 RepID=UPI0025841793|nr:serpin family protein [Tenuifilum sp.]
MNKMKIMILALLTGTAAKAQTPSDAVNEFAFDLYRNLKTTESQNLVFSPFSISPAFGMVSLGANGETLNQLNSTFHFKTGKEFHKGLGNLQREVLKSANDSVTINITNRVWIENSYRVRRKFRCNLKRTYGAKFAKADFVTNPENSRLQINKTIEDDTHEFIKNLLPERSISNLTRLVLTNAIYFKGKWEEPFNPKKTKERGFFPANSNKQMHPFMNADKTFGYYKGKNFAALEMDYKGGELSMIIVLPDESLSLEKFEIDFNLKTYNEIVENIKPQKTLVFIPKFSIESGFTMKKTLYSMGMSIPFSDDADFSGISGKKDLKISNAFHKAFIEVSEEGTTAAAATAVVVAMKSMPNFNVFDANRPFIYILRHKPTNTIMFMGKLVSPK